MAFLLTLLKSATSPANLKKKLLQKLQESRFYQIMTAVGPQPEVFHSLCLQQTCQAASQRTCRYQSLSSSSSSSTESSPSLSSSSYSMTIIDEVPPCCARAFINSPALLRPFPNANLFDKCEKLQDLKNHLFYGTVAFSHLKQ